MLLLVSVRLAAAIHRLLYIYAPTNILMRHLRNRRGLWWAIPTAVVLVPAYLFAAGAATTLMERGGPEWLNVLVLLFVWNAMKFSAMALWTIALVSRGQISKPRRRSIWAWE
jgi:hypothetical protein